MNPTIPKDVTIALRRATEADADAIHKLIGRAPAAGDHRATFMLSEDGVPAGAVDVVQQPDALVIDAIAVAEAHRGKGHGAALLEFAESIGRDMGLKEIRLSPALPVSTFFDKFDYRDGRRRLDAARPYLQAVGVPLWRSGVAPLGRVAYYRGTWAALATIVSVGSISLLVFGSGELQLGQLIFTGIISGIAALFALWQIALILSAARRAQRSSGALATMALSLLAIAGIGYSTAFKAVPQFEELASIYLGDRELSDYVVLVTPTGLALHIEGSLGTGVAKSARLLLDEHKSIRTVLLNSPGGRIGEGQDLFDMIRQRKLNTHVLGECHSACTIAFLGGAERTISPDGVLGFHQGGFPGMNAAEMRDANLHHERFLIRAGVSREFAARALKTPHNDIWVPTHDELKAGRVIHRVKE
ncbi:MAG TPA: GNAT family N-acetyltransferase [Reyranellaceae bacterium]|nr:GNAT family N-acetyltransferase [Reyranellaceae bacterium]